MNEFGLLIKDEKLLRKEFFNSIYELTNDFGNDFSINMDTNLNIEQSYLDISFFVAVVTNMEKRKNWEIDMFNFFRSFVKFNDEKTGTVGDVFNDCILQNVYKKDLEMSKVKEYYNFCCGNDPYIHCNRFPIWEELSSEQQQNFKRNTYDKRPFAG